MLVKKTWSFVCSPEKKVRCVYLEKPSLPRFRLRVAALRGFFDVGLKRLRVVGRRFFVFFCSFCPARVSTLSKDKLNLPKRDAAL